MLESAKQPSKKPRQTVPSRCMRSSMPMPRRMRSHRTIISGRYKPLKPDAYSRGKAKYKVPPPASSQTSLPSQTGPMVRITVRRSWSVLAMNRCSTPAPRSKPSRTTYAVIIIATSQNHMKSIRRFLLRYRIRIAGIQVLSGRARAVRDLAIDEHQKQDCQHGVKAHEAEQGKQPVAGMNVFRIALAGAHESVDQPGLAANFRGHPAGGVGDIRQRQAEHDDPEQPARFIQLSSPQQERSRSHYGDEDRPQSGHDVIAVIQQRDIRGPLVLRKLIQAFDLGSTGAVNQEAQDLVDNQRIVNALMLFVRLAQDYHGRAIFSLEQAF